MPPENILVVVATLVFVADDVVGTEGKYVWCCW